MKTLTNYLTASLCLVVMAMIAACKEKQVQSKEISTCGVSKKGICTSRVPARFSVGSTEVVKDKLTKALPSEDEVGRE